MGLLLEEWSGDHAYVLCLLTFAAGADLELDLLADLETAISVALDSCVVDEDVVAFVSGDEPVALLVVEELDGASRQCVSRFWSASGRPNGSLTIGAAR